MAIQHYRCCDDNPAYLRYHDRQWGVLVVKDRLRIFSGRFLMGKQFTIINPA